MSTISPTNKQLGLRRALWKPASRVQLQLLFRHLGIDGIKSAASEPLILPPKVQVLVSFELLINYIIYKHQLTIFYLSFKHFKFFAAFLINKL